MVSRTVILWLSLLEKQRCPPAGGHNSTMKGDNFHFRESYGPIHDKRVWSLI